MLKEIKNVRQIEGEEFRRWFMDEYFDLIIWFDNDNKIAGFQLCYDKNNFERSITWKYNHGFYHNKVDDGELSGRSKMTPILVQDGQFDNKGIGNKFKSAAAEMEEKLKTFIYEKILEADVN